MTLAIRAARRVRGSALNGSTAGAALRRRAISGQGGQAPRVISSSPCLLRARLGDANSRMIYAFSRDGAIPGHKLWHRLHPKTRSAGDAVCWRSVWLPARRALLYQVGGYCVAFFAIVSIGTVGSMWPTAIPIFLRLRAGSAFKPGP